MPDPFTYYLKLVLMGPDLNSEMPDPDGPSGSVIVPDNYNIRALFYRYKIRGVAGLVLAFCIVGGGNVSARQGLGAGDELAWRLVVETNQKFSDQCEVCFGKCGRATKGATPI